MINNTQLPVAGWLSTASLINKQYSKYFFVLIDTEIRVYNHELDESPIETLSLGRILEITPIGNKTFQIELNSENPWIITSESESDMELWKRAIKERREKYNTCEPLLTRRKKKLSPIITHPTFQPLLTSTSSSFGSPISSTTSSVFSPMITRVPPNYEETSRETKVNTGFLGKSQIVNEDELSPTYLLYKKRFRL